jgi:hypothetical protein
MHVTLQGTTHKRFIECTATSSHALALSLSLSQACVVAAAGTNINHHLSLARYSANICIKLVSLFLYLSKMYCFKNVLYDEQCLSHHFLLVAVNSRLEFV